MKSPSNARMKVTPKARSSRLSSILIKFELVLISMRVDESSTNFCKLLSTLTNSRLCLTGSSSMQMKLYMPSMYTEINYMYM